eukprot:6742728-Ditylum_brightwellii.AAC.1
MFFHTHSLARIIIISKSTHNKSHACKINCTVTQHQAITGQQIGIPKQDETRKKKRKQDFQDTLPPKNEVAPQEKCKPGQPQGLKNKEREFIATSSTSKSERKMTSTTTTRVPAKDALDGLFAMMAAAEIYDQNSKAALQEEVIDLEDKSDGYEESDKESDNPNCKDLIYEVNLEGECTKLSVPKLHHDAKDRIQIASSPMTKLRIELQGKGVLQQLQ